MYQFSAPMPYTIEDIDNLLNINNLVKKSKITGLYACVPRDCEVFTDFEQSRNLVSNYTNWEYWKKLIQYTISKDCDFIYLLNKPQPIDIENPNFKNRIEKLEKLLYELNKIGVNKLRIASGQLMNYISKHFPEFKIYVSTSLEYKTIWEFQNFLALHPYVKQIIPSHDVNKNFKMLSFLTKKHKNIEIELMVNEGCLQGCPNRMLHEMISIDKKMPVDIENCLTNSFCTNFCMNIVKKHPIKSLVIGNLIFPWDIEEYAKIGIKKFKFVGRDGYLLGFNTYINGFTMYLKGIDNISDINEYSLSCFSHHLNGSEILRQLNVKDYKRYLPNIKHFVKNGHLCASRCAIECKYCYKCAEKIQKLFQKKQREKEKMPHFVAACKI